MSFSYEFLDDVAMADLAFDARGDTLSKLLPGATNAVMISRAQAKKAVRAEQVQRQMKQQCILVKAVSLSGLAEEAGFAYKNISDVVESVTRAGITKTVAELRPIGNIKG
jgi:tRNA-splicing ligase RtcB (3'-phosphate/5'-hydroxy nucleic acid ligase)